MQNGEENYPGDLVMSRSADVMMLLFPHPPNRFADSVLVGTGVPLLVGISVPQQPPWAGESGRIVIKRNPFLTELDTQEWHWSQCRVTLNNCRNLINTFINQSLQKSLLVNA